MRDMFVKTLTEIAGKDKNVYLVTADLGFGVLKPFWEQYPDRFVNLGIAEQNMTGFAAGMALEGKTVFTYSIANFPTLRCLEQIRNDCAYHNANVKIVSVGGGFVYGALGMSHHATEDLSVMRALPGLTVMAPADLTEAACAARAVYEQPGTCYLRLGRGGETKIHEKLEGFRVGKALKIKDGTEVAVFSTGAIFEEAKKALELLAPKGLDPALYTFPTVKPIDREVILACGVKYKLLVTLEENNITGGFGSAVSEVLSELSGSRAKLLRFGIKDEYSSIVGSQNYLRDYYGISAPKLYEQILTTYRNLHV